MNNFRNIAILLLIGVAGFYACEEGERFGISSDDTTPPNPPHFDSIRPLAGGARIFYKIPDDVDLLSIEAAFTATNGEVVKSAVSLMAPPVLEIFGLSDTLEKTIDFYALDRAGNKSTIQQLKVKPQEPTYTRVAKSLNVHAGFGSLLVTWKNELGLDVNVFVDFTFSDNGVTRSLRQAYSSRDSVERKLIKSDKFSTSNPISVKVSVEDRYGNLSAPIDKGQITLQSDELIDKKAWEVPVVGYPMGGVTMSDGSSYGSRVGMAIDGIINDLLHPGNFAHFGYTIPANQSLPAFNLLIDLGAKYRLSRILTHQRYFAYMEQLTNPGDSNYGGIRGELYRNENVGIYRMYWWDGLDDGTSGDWREISQVKIPMPPLGMSSAEIAKLGLLGDESLMYPDSSGFTPPTRWFRYESVKPFANNYNAANIYASCLSEITLYGKKEE
ncbi:hypothetical protein SAMD00024442_42_7 [Candidatus Symbiothrix dinenymphae]|nr:hypothetical protein SAMD00024442_42_7 [Candidatus Symbiothrix dinenymphae]